MGRACSTYGEKRNAYMVFVGKPDGKRPLRRPRRRWVNKIKIDLKERSEGVLLFGLIWLGIGTSGRLL
jgi:hypothetical protein